jgi:hypothetical protein
MAIQTFSDSSDGLTPDARDRGHFIAQLDLDDSKAWIPYANGVWIQPCHFNVTTGGFTVLLKAMPGASLGVHYHTGTVRGLTLRGNWRYLEHDWVARPGTFIYEPAGEAHTLVITDDSAEPALIFFVVEGSLVYLDKAVDGNFAAFEDGFSALELARAYYRDAGLDPAILDRMVR